MEKGVSVTPFDTSLKLGMVIPYDLTKIFDRRLRKFSSAILDFGGHLGFSRAKNSFFTKMAVVWLIFELELSKIHRMYFRTCTNRWTFQFLDRYPWKKFPVQNIPKIYSFSSFFRHFFKLKLNIRPFHIFQWFNFDCKKCSYLLALIWN